MVVRLACAGRCLVTLHTEGVDRNHEPPVGDNVILPVTLHTEGVDYKLGMKKPSPLKEWSIPR